MKLRASHYALLAAFLPLAACSSSPPPPPPAMAQPVSALSAQDAAFVTAAAQGGMAEVKDGQLAANKGGTAAIRAFGTQMVNDHTPNNAQLMSIAQSKNAAVPTDLSPEQQATMQKLQTLKGRAFDIAYLHSQVEGHQQMAQVMQQEIDTGTDPDLKNFAMQTLPVVKSHLAKAEALSHPARRPVHHAMTKPAG